jgi:hypothetical protein
MGGAKITRPPRHHVFPKAERNFFLDRGVNIDLFTLELNEGVHQALHGGGNYQLALEEWEGHWNAEIMRRLRTAEAKVSPRLLHEDEMKDVARQLMSDYFVVGKFVRYRAR